MEQQSTTLQVTFVNEADAPRPAPRARRQVTRELVTILRDLPEGHVARIVPQGQTQRGLKIAIGRIARHRGWSVATWTVPGDKAVYVKPVDDVESRTADRS